MAISAASDARDASQAEPAASALSVLYLHPIGAFGGASRSLLELLRAFPPGSVRPCIVAQQGQSTSLLREAGYPVIAIEGMTQFDCTRYGHYRKWRWLILLRELWYLLPTVWGVLKARRAWPQVDLIHANEITAIVPALVAKALLRKPLIVHVRSVQQTDAIPRRRRWLLSQLRRHADAVVAIDATVRASLPADLHVEIVHNAFSPAAVTEIPEPVRAVAERLHAGSLRVGLVGNLLALKGVYEFLVAAKLCAESKANVDFIIVGSGPRPIAGLRGALLRWFGFARDVEGDLDRYLVEHGLQDRVHRIPFTPHISAVYRTLDVLCFPSHLDAVGRPVLEAAWFGVPSVVAVDRPSPDTLIDGETGVRVPARDPHALATTFARMATHREEFKKMGAAARRLAERNFDARQNAARMLSVYRRVLGARFSPPEGRSRDDAGT